MAKALAVGHDHPCRGPDRLMLKPPVQFQLRAGTDGSHLHAPGQGIVPGDLAQLTRQARGA